MIDYFKIFLLFLFLCVSSTGFAQQTDGHRLPFIDAEIFTLDRSHSNLEFSIGYLGLIDVKGTFDDYSATILYNEKDMSKTAIILRIDASSIDTGNERRDKDLRSERFFDTDNYPELVFESKRIEEVSDGEYVVTGDLTMKGVTKEILVPIQNVLKRTEDFAWENIKMGFAGHTTVNRIAFDIHGGDFWGLKALSEDVQVSFTLLGNIFNLERFAWRSKEKPSIGEEMDKIIEKEGIEAALNFYTEAKQNSPEGYNFAAREFYQLASKLKQREAIDDALKICEPYLKAYPESAAAHSLKGELLAMNKDRKGAIASFQRVLELEPEDDLAKMVLKRLN